MTTTTRSTSPRPSKRRRTASLEGDLLTPPQQDDDPLNASNQAAPCYDSDDDNEDIFSYASHVLATEAAALASITALYRTSAVAKQNLRAAVKTIVQTQHERGKLIVTGVGKSAYIGQKLVATCKSMGVAASFMHACEAAHGDLGDVRDNDTLLFISYSGKTPELINLLPHIPATTPIIAMSSPTSRADCPLLIDRPREMGILLPTPIPASEEDCFGVSAPTISTTVAIAVSDMLSLTVAERLHRNGAGKREVFKRNHPGGAIGMSTRELKVMKKAEVKVEALELPSPSISANDED
ncbi:hypothetical protein MBLNU13_g01075t1 [Cladosporium sp. NU13]